MRSPVAVAALLLGLGLLVSGGEPAKADPTVTLTWTSSALGATGLGTNTVLAQPGDTLTLSVSVTIGIEGLTGFATSYSWNPGVLQHALSVLDMTPGWQVTGNGLVDNGAGFATSQLGATFITSIGPASTTIHHGDLTFVSTGAAGPTTIVTGLFTETDGANSNSLTPYTDTTFLPAFFFTVPEPGTALLLAAGIGALLLVRRGCRPV